MTGHITCHITHHTSHVTNVTNNQKTALDPLGDTFLEMSQPQHQYGTVINVLLFVTCDVVCHAYYSPMVVLGL